MKKVQESGELNNAGGFHGFTRETLRFYRGLIKDNSRAYFEKNRRVYEAHVMEPSRRFVTEMGEKLEKLSFDLHAEPRVDRSIFRIYRDSRFSRDKTPFKTHLALWFWDGPGKRMECPGYYFHLEPGRLMVGTGLYMFPDTMIKKYRDYVAEEKNGALLHRALTSLAKKGYYYGEERYKKVPRGYDSGYRYADYLKLGGLYAGIEFPVPPELYEKGLTDFCLKYYRDMFPLHTWIYDMVRRIG